MSHQFADLVFFLIASVHATIAFVIIILVHELGHFIAAVWLRVPVKKLSIGYGEEVIHWQSKNVRIAVARWPVGGYLEMQKNVPGEFRSRSAWQRSLIYLAGPLANVMLAMLILGGACVIDLKGMAPTITTPDPRSLAALMGMSGGDQIARLRVQGEEPWVRVRSYADLTPALKVAALKRQKLEISYLRGHDSHVSVLDLSRGLTLNDDRVLFYQIGIGAPQSSPTIKSVKENSAAQAAGLGPGQTVLAVNGQEVKDVGGFKNQVLSWAKTGQTKLTLTVLAGDEVVEKAIQPDTVKKNLGFGPEVIPTLGIGFHSGGVPVSIGETPLQSFVHALHWTLDYLHAYGLQILSGTASITHILDPFVVPNHAGVAVFNGISSWCMYTYIVCLCLGVFNLLPLPRLDGQHLTHILIEGAMGERLRKNWRVAIDMMLGMSFLFIFYAAFANELYSKMR